MQIEKMKIQFKKRKIIIYKKDNNNKDNDKTVTEEIIEKNTKST